MSKEKRRVPKLRFPGFTEDWEQRKLGSIGSTYTGLSGKTKEDFGHGEAEYITYLNVFQNTISDIIMTDKVEIDTTQNEVKYGDVLFTTSSETPEEVGMSSVWLGDTPNIYLNSFCFGFRPNQKINPYFLGYSLRAPYMRDKIKILAQGISRYNISKNKVMELEISLPNYEEQKLLGTFLQRIDLIITLHQRKLDNLKLKKKALLQKLFPKNGERYPELRFPGFTDAWEQRKLGAMCSLFTDGDWIESKDQSNEGIRLIQTGNIGVGKFIDKPENKKWISHSTFNNLKCKELLDGDILISRLPQPAGRACIINTNNEKWITAVDCTIVRLLDQYSNKFILQSLCTYSYFHLIDSFLAGGTRQRVSRSNLSDINIMSPEKIEQDKIGLFFECIDNLITLHQRKLDHLKLQKKALLQQMFV